MLIVLVLLLQQLMLMVHRMRQMLVECGAGQMVDTMKELRTWRISAELLLLLMLDHP